MMERYYVKIKGERGPAVAHDTLAEAYAEAKRLLAKKTDAKMVYVLQAIGVVKREDLVSK